MLKSSRIPGLHQQTPAARRAQVLAAVGLQQHPDGQQLQSADDAAVLQLADAMVENAIGTMPVPLGVATNLIVDGEDVLVPMATEESSVIAAVCNGARQCRASGGVRTVSVGSCMIAQIQVSELSAPHAAAAELHRRIDEIRHICDECDRQLVSVGGGFRDLQIRVLTPTMLVIHLIVDTRDAMGANAVNTMAETLSPEVAQWSGGKVGLRILSNLADRRTVRASATFRCDDIGGASVRDAIIAAGEFACLDPYRATTHNKGIMNGVSAVVLATGNDTRAVEAGAHAFAARDGHYTALSRWEESPDGDLVGSLEVPLAVGIVGGATRVHATARLCLAIMQIQSAAQLAGIIAAVGLVQNFSALKALATEGIQRGHMSLHAKNVALAAGASGAEVDRIAQQLIDDGTINERAAAALLNKT